MVAGFAQAGSDRHITVAIDERRQVVRIARTALPLGSAADVAVMVSHVQRSLHKLDRAQFSVLIDIRRALLADESRYAVDAVVLRREMVRGFRRNAFLVETQVGMLQVQRLAREEKLTTRVYFDEQEALEFLAGG